MTLTLHSDKLLIDYQSADFCKRFAGLQVMQQAAKTGKQSMAELDIDNVDKIMGEINEQSDAMASINDALAQPLGGAAVIDEDDLEAELEVLFPSHLLPDIGFC